MKGLATLIKLHKRHLDALRKQMAELERQKDNLIALSGRLAQELMDEMGIAGDHPDFSNFFGDYATRIKKRQLQIAKEVISLNEVIGRLHHEIADAFSELKKYEIAAENIKKREKQEAERKEQIRLDDIAVDQFIRKEQ